MRFRTWPVAAVGLGSLLVLIVVAMLTTSRKAQDIYTQLDQLNSHHHDVDAKLRRLRSTSMVGDLRPRLSARHCARASTGVPPESGPPSSGKGTSRRLRNCALAEPHAEQIRSLQVQLEDYWETFDPLFDWTVGEKIFLR